ncbi:aerobic glycerol-3-phosphate dehydrogenase [Salmonella enterica subsp. enterica]|uniref:Aerobic glycerol-3-phosphate dehydrogenase n=1 Tax=Salmonella enterica I TaxID=59201 RepID=A0A379WL47_SALET|nr:aerobic glycerol-3-phosphate dehydrogenase [Salmonella enterica subsp. enterica]
MHLPSPYGIRLIKGSHIVVPRVHNQKQAYILQNEDKRIVFVIPWMEEFSIIGTTDVEYKGDPKAVKIEESEINYLLKVYNAHFQKQLGRDDIVWTYSGVRPLCDDESDSPQAITRDYTLDIHDENGKAPLLPCLAVSSRPTVSWPNTRWKNWRLIIQASGRHGPKRAYCPAATSTAAAKITRRSCVVVIRS